MLTDANWCWLMLIDADSCWLMPLDADWCLEMLIDAYRCWLMLIYADWCSNKVQPGILLSERTSGAFWSILNPINVHLIRKTENYSRNCSGFQGLDVQGSLHPVTPHHSTTPASPSPPFPLPTLLLVNLLLDVARILLINFSCIAGGSWFHCGIRDNSNWVFYRT